MFFQSGDGRVTGVASLVGRVRGLKDDVQKKISRMRTETVAEQKHSDQAFPCSASSIESLPSGSGSSKNYLISIIGNPNINKPVFRYASPCKSRKQSQFHFNRRC